MQCKAVPTEQNRMNPKSQMFILWKEPQPYVIERPATTMANKRIVVKELTTRSLDAHLLQITLEQFIESIFKWDLADSCCQCYTSYGKTNRQTVNSKNC